MHGATIKKKPDTSSWHATVNYSKCTKFYIFLFLSKAGASSLVVARGNNVIVSTCKSYNKWNT